MRAGIGLLSLLIGVAVIFYISFGYGKHGYEGEVLEQGKVANQQVQQMAGKDANNVPVGDSIVLEDDMVGSELRGEKVVSVVTGGAMATAYGLQAGDDIVQAEQMDLRGSDGGMAKALVVESYSKNSPLVIRRGGQQMTLNPNTPLSQDHQGLFAKPGTVIDPNSIAIPTH
jgi:hypothetical protein